MDFLIIFQEEFLKRFFLLLSLVAPGIFITRFGIDCLLIKNPHKFNWLRGNNEMSIREAASYEMQQAVLGDFIPLIAARLKLGVLTATAIAVLVSCSEAIQLVLAKV